MSKSSTAQIQSDTSTRHDIRILLPDTILENIDPNDEVYVHLAGRGKEVTRKMGFRDIEHFLATGDLYTEGGEYDPQRRKRDDWGR